MCLGGKNELIMGGVMQRFCGVRSILLSGLEASEDLC
jgi:hypothetical protein